MPTIRMRSRPVVLLGVLAVGVPMLGALLATPAVAFGFRFHGGAASPTFARRQMTPSPTMPAGTARLRHVPSTATVSSTVAARSMRVRSRVSASAGTRSAAAKTPKISGDICAKLHTCISIPKANNDINPGGPSTAATQAPSFSQGGPAPGANTLPGGGAPGGGSASAGMSGPGTSRGNTTSGLAPMPSPSSGGGPGQFTTAGGSANDSPGTRSLNGPASNRPSTGGAGATRTETTPNATTQGTVKGNTTAPNTQPTATLTAVTVCMTRAGSCPMERDAGTACQCKDGQGNVYDGIIK
jgi:hypothetical protein